MARLGRKTKLTPDIQQRIVEALRAGNYRETASAYAGIHKATFYEWMNRGEAYVEGESPESERIFADFYDAVEKAVADSEVRDVTLIAKAAETQWQAAAWRLERKFPKRWGRKLEADVNASVAVTLTDVLEDAWNELENESGTQAEASDVEETQE